jgi:hypothetical protein
MHASIAFHTTIPHATKPTPMHAARKSRANKFSHASCSRSHTSESTRVKVAHASWGDAPCQKPNLDGPLKYTHLAPSTTGVHTHSRKAARVADKIVAILSLERSLQGFAHFRPGPLNEQRCPTDFKPLAPEDAQDILSSAHEQAGVTPCLLFLVRAQRRRCERCMPSKTATSSTVLRGDADVCEEERDAAAIVLGAPNGGCKTRPAL